VTREEIQEAIKCNNWQTLRLSLKGHETAHKLRMLKVYLKQDMADGCCESAMRRTQVYNYLNALSRGGQIDPVREGDLEMGRVHIRR
jgi:hypothetical protein